MNRAISLHIGVWKPSGYSGLAELSSPKAEPYALAAIAQHHGFDQCSVLAGPDAKWPTLQQKIQEAGKNLVDGGLFLLTFSGHGTHAPDGIIQSWCLDDQKVSDEDLFSALGEAFSDQTRIVIVSASCFSGGLSGLLHRVLGSIVNALKAMFNGKADSTGATPPPAAVPSLGPRVLVLAACRASQKALDATPLSLFVGKVWDVWQNGNFSGTYSQFMDQVGNLVSDDNQAQIPKMVPHGSSHDWSNEPLFQV